MTSLETSPLPDSLPFFPPQGAGVIYYSTPKEFFGAFPTEWAKVSQNFRKFESRQVYVEDAESLRAFLRGEREKAIDLLTPSDREIAFHNDIRKRGASYNRVRSIDFPVSQYLQWEILSYQISSKLGQNIYITDHDVVKLLQQRRDLGDFMVFDNHSAMLHNNTDDGQVVGGWLVTDKKYIESLIELFDYLLNISEPLEATLRQHPELRI